MYPQSKGRKTANKSRPADDLFVGISKHSKDCEERDRYKEERNAEI